jgi:hypothetical protein
MNSLGYQYQVPVSDNEDLTGVRTERGGRVLVASVVSAVVRSAGTRFFVGRRTLRVLSRKIKLLNDINVVTSVGRTWCQSMEWNSHLVGGDGYSTSFLSTSIIYHSSASNA